ncbi:hypothetical protein QQS21_004653 [Conoideocrella luteorostrata]|uniref:Glucose receptor Git3 N-terminal domain-containing protein n=1 Tax=Conoideocrella luteorostrata TaxID=1105319 RepID=A0AAJ0FV88_9HYPO|nr:hypothetical protein QQS21_004653 [Conoideocrella luteorostrata]
MSQHIIPIDKVIAVPTFIGSLLSLITTSTAITLHINFPPNTHCRHALILNLLVADWINSLDNSISGGIVLSNGYTFTQKAPASAACLTNAWVGQVSVQAVDFNILIISIAVLITVYGNDRFIGSSRRGTILMCAAPWIPGLITGSIGLGLGAYGHVSGNWCWIRPDRLYLRYALTHAWRIAIFIATLVIYTFIYLRLRKVFNEIRLSQAASWSTSLGLQNQEATTPMPSDTQSTEASRPRFGPNNTQDPLKRSIDSLEIASADMPQGSGMPKFSHNDFATRTDTIPHHAQNIENIERPSYNEQEHFSILPARPNLKKVLLMNGYPIAYIILWIPGIANRLAESAGISSRWLQALQASTQFIGFVNALTYGMNEQMRRQAWEKWKGFGRFNRT